MSTLKEKTEAQVAKSRQAKPEFMQAMDELMAKAHKFEQGSEAIDIGQQAPTFTLPNAQGQDVALSHLRRKGPVVVTFYRGDWCPYCNLQLRALQSILGDIHELGAELVAISPQVPDDSLSKSEISELGFQVLSDQDARAAASYGVAWEVPELILQHMRNDRGLDLASINNGNGSMLPIPATFVLNADGKVIWRFVDVDYRTRAEPADIIAALKANQIN
tara:strand:+ start:71 stop:727 length:657 start_codon:yes stop_codon:yes gene_type:complete